MRQGAKAVAVACLAWLLARRASKEKPAAGDRGARDYAFDKLLHEYAQMREEERQNSTITVALYGLAVATLGGISVLLMQSCDVLHRKTQCLDVPPMLYGLTPLPVMAIVAFVLMIFNLAILRDPYVKLLERHLQQYPGRLKDAGVDLPFPVYHHLNRPVFGARTSYGALWLIIWLAAWSVVLALTLGTLWIWYTNEPRWWIWGFAAFDLFVLGCLANAFRKIWNERKLMTTSLEGLNERIREPIVER